MRNRHRHREGGCGGIWIAGVRTQVPLERRSVWGQQSGSDLNRANLQVSTKHLSMLAHCPESIINLSNAIPRIGAGKRSEPNLNGALLWDDVEREWMFSERKRLTAAADDLTMTQSSS